MEEDFSSCSPLQADPVGKELLRHLLKEKRSPATTPSPGSQTPPTARCQPANDSVHSEEEDRLGSQGTMVSKADLMMIMMMILLRGLMLVRMMVCLMMLDRMLDLTFVLMMVLILVEMMVLMMMMMVLILVLVMMVPLILVLTHLLLPAPGHQPGPAGPVGQEEDPSLQAASQV